MRIVNRQAAGRVLATPPRLALNHLLLSIGPVMCCAGLFWCTEVVTLWGNFPHALRMAKSKRNVISDEGEWLLLVCANAAILLYWT